MSELPISKAPQVVIIGAGPAGLSLAIELGHRNIDCLVLERSTRAGYAPRAKTTHSRTREHLRRWGIADKLAEASPFGVDFPSHVLFVTRLGGHLLHRFEHALDCNPATNEHYAEHGQWIPQYKLEAVLREHAQSLPQVEIQYGQELIDFDETETGVRAYVRSGEDGAERTVDARFLVGADGARSRVRDLIGARMEGVAALSRNYNIIFRAPGMEKAHSHGPGIMYWQINPQAPSLIGPMDSGDLWFMMPTQVPDGVTYSDAEAESLIRTATGIDTDITILSSDEWTASKLIADRYRRGSAFLVGDACHLHPPFGGFGMNLGIGDSVDLGWKLAAVLQGWGGNTLLSSYETERRQAHEIVVAAADANHSILANQLVVENMEEDSPEGERIRAHVASLIDTHKRSEFYARGIVLGYCYRQSPLITDDGSQAGWASSNDYVPSAIPGCRAPHAWLDDKSSLYDHFGPGFTLLVLDAHHSGDIAAARQEAERQGIPLTVLYLPDARLAQLYEAPLALIRPDQHVAWRGAAWADSKVLSCAAGRIQ